VKTAFFHFSSNQLLNVCTELQGCVYVHVRHLVTMTYLWPWPFCCRCVGCDKWHIIHCEDISYTPAGSARQPTQQHVWQVQHIG